MATPKPVAKIQHAVSAERAALDARVERIVAAFGPVVTGYGLMSGIEIDVGKVVCVLLDRIEALEMAAKEWER